MLIILLGPPGAGKGTQGEKIVSTYGFVYVSTGEILRDAVKEGRSLGKKAQYYMDQGKLVPDDIIVEIIKERLLEPDCQAGALLDGFPRNLVQAEFLDEVLSVNKKSIDLVVFINLDETELIERLTGRRVCTDCSMNYNLTFKPPRVRNICDNCGGDLYQRTDDTVDTVKERLSVYREQTEPLIKYFQEKDLLVTIDGSTDIDNVFMQIKSVIDKKKDR